MLFHETADYFGWPTNEAHAVSPIVAKACKRIESELKGSSLCSTSIIPYKPEEPDRSGSLAIVCEFETHPGEYHLKEAHRLAWNLCEGEQIIFLINDQRTIQAWSTLVPPSVWRDAALAAPVEIPPSNTSGSNDLLRAFHWINLSSGFFKKQEPSKFKSNQRADSLLVENLRTIRRELIESPSAHHSALSTETCHNLLARLIFIQYLIQRKDSSGEAFLSPEVFAKLHTDEVLNAKHADLISLLHHKTDTYKLFRWLNQRFNGDLFPSEGSSTFTKEQREVKKEHLLLLADYLSGKRHLKSGQGLLWEYYSFETIPISFISSMYEEFLTEHNKKGNKAFYTQPYLVDFILDTALPWNSTEWDLKILDPCCGSGIFLVKAFQRIAHRWKLAHGNVSPSVEALKALLKKNFTGVDINPEAIRVASFSLYLAMADEIDPREYWKTDKDHPVFPDLRGSNLLDSDFFNEEHLSISSTKEGNRYDLVIGNAPWGKNSIDPLRRTKAQRQKNGVVLFAEEWSKQYDWPTSNRDIGPLFYAKALTLTSKGGGVAMVQPAGLLLNQSGPIKEFRKKLFSSAQILEVDNFSILRFQLFSQAIGPSCVIYSINDTPNTTLSTTYLCPRTIDGNHVVIEPSDWSDVTLRDLRTNPHIWALLMWGDDRHIELARKLTRLKNIQQLIADGTLLTREGIIRGNKQRSNNELVGRRILDSSTTPPILFQDPEKLPINEDNRFDATTSRDFSSFQPPQILLKQSWAAKTKRFGAISIEQVADSRGVLCSDSYTNVHQTDGSNWLDAIWLVFNSKVAVWWQMLHSGRFLSFLPQPLEKDLRSIPLPATLQIERESLNSFAKIDHAAKTAFNFSEAEWVLIDDLFTYSLADFKERTKSAGRSSTHRKAPNKDSLSEYAHYLMRMLRNGFGDASISATVFYETNDTASLPVRVFALHLSGNQSQETVSSVPLAEDKLLNLIQDLHHKLLRPTKQGSPTPGFSYERHLRLYDTYTPQGETVAIPTVYIVKPDRMNCWTRTQAMRDADSIAADILRNSNLIPEQTV